jgi:hypothetical protein
MDWDTLHFLFARAATFPELIPVRSRFLLGPFSHIA